MCDGDPSSAAGLHHVRATSISRVTAEHYFKVTKEKGQLHESVLVDFLYFLILLLYSEHFLKITFVQILFMHLK